MTHTAIPIEQRKKQLDQIERALLLTLFTSYLLVAAIISGWLAYREVPLKKWSPDTRLNNYSPLDAGALKKLQQECRTFGDLDPVSVNKWLEIEMKSVESQGNDLSQEISNETLPIKKPKILPFLNRDLSVH